MYKMPSHIPSKAIVTYTGTQFDVTDRSTWVFDIQDIAKSLSNLCRYNGHVDYYSVAEHLVRVADYLRMQGYPKRVQLMGLLHDAHEAYTSDAPAPFKSLITIMGRPLKEVEDDVTNAIFAQCGIEDYHEGHEAVEHADHEVFLMEYAERPRPGKGLPPAAAEMEFLNKFYQLID